MKLTFILNRYEAIHGKPKGFGFWNFIYHKQEEPSRILMTPYLPFNQLRGCLRHIEGIREGILELLPWSGQYCHFGTTTNGHTYRFLYAEIEPLNDLAARSEDLNELQSWEKSRLRDLAETLQLPLRTQLSKQNLIFAIGIYLQDKGLQLKDYTIE